MQTLKEIKEWFYEDISNRYLDFLWEEEKYIVDTLTSDVNESWEYIAYTKDVVVDIVFQALDWYQMNANENTIWESWYVRWYEIALQDILSDLTNIAIFDEIKSDKDIETYIRNLLNN
jgi:hypothetical protein